MTSIERIQISGVRSFDPNPAHRQTIVFQKPLTVILGKNGAGKTTIIEALLNACTGQMPPGSGSEKSSFVYDPKVMNETDVKAQIRLLFTGRGGKVIQVIRSFQAIRARNKTSFATLDNAIAFQDAVSGKIVSSTYRANDVDRAVPEMLGVSPAVLEHVIFCHQEDGNWPLLPPKDVKRIFDDIFAATRYVLALDRLRENSKEFRRQQKEHEANLMALREHRDQAQQLARDIDAKETLAQTIQQRAKALEPQLKELHAVAAALSAAEQSAESLAREAALIQGRIEEKQQSLNRFGILSTEQTLEEILEQKQVLAERMKALEKEASEKAIHLQVAEANHRQYEETTLGLRTNLRFLEQQEWQHRQNCAEFQRIARDILVDFVFSTDDMDEDIFQRVSGLMNAELQKAIGERDEALKNIDDKMKIVEEERAGTLRLMDADSKEKEMKEEQQRHLQDRILNAEETLRRLKPHTSATHIQTLKGQMTELEQRVEAVELLKKNGERYKQRQSILQHIDAQNRVVAELRQELVKHKELSNEEAEMNLLRTQIAEKQKVLDTGMRERLLPNLSRFGHEVSEGRSLMQVSLLIERLRDQKMEALRLIQGERSELDRQVAVLQQVRTQRMEDIMRENMELQQKRTACLKVLKNTDEVDRFETIFEQARESFHKARNQQHALEAMSACYANFVEVAKAEGKCPVCDRGFNDEGALINFLELNEKQKEASPENVARAQLEAARAEQMVRCLEGVEADVHDVRRLAFSIPKLEQMVASMNEELANKCALLEDVECKQRDVEDQLGRVQELLQDAKDLNVCASDIRAFGQELGQREEAIKKRQAKAAVVGGDESENQTYEQLSLEYERANAELYRLNLMLNEAQRRDEGESDQAVANELNVKRAECYQLEMKLMRQRELEEVIAQAGDEADGYKERILAIHARRVELENQLRGINSRLQACQMERRDLERAAQMGRIMKIEESMRMLAAVVSKIRGYITSRDGDRLTETRERLRVAEASSLASAEEVKQLHTAIQEARRVVEEGFRRSAEMDKHIEALGKRQSIAEDQSRLRDVEASIAELKIRELHGVEAILGKDLILRESVPRIREIIRSKVSELERSRALQEGNVEAMVQDIANLKSQLGREKYQDIEKRYRSTFLKLQTTEIAVADIEKYYRALEKAVQSYHQEKIAQINQILAELWRQTYRGSDIDTIELRSEDDVTSTTARRSYSYRVVMKRGNSEMDMRGRCSAGQKVLASVLIRLALSEAFCCDCGILALDEPTTNLDEDNARSLAESLRLLIDNHRAVKHFQLIVITHDEQFVRALGGQALDTFYYVHKDREGAFSVIEERTFDQLFAA